MSLAYWLQPYEYNLDPSWLAKNTNPNLIPYLCEEEHINIIDWSSLSNNPNALEMLKQNMCCIDWQNICLNPHPEAIELIQKHHEEYLQRWNEKRRRIPYDMVLSWENLSQNPSAIKFLKKYPTNTLWSKQEPPYDPHEDDVDYKGNPYFENLHSDYEINWLYLSGNRKATKILKKNPENIDWCWLSRNTSHKAIKLLKKFPQNINWYWLSQNPSAMDVIEENLDKVDWRQLCKNPNAMHLFEDNTIEIEWSYLSANPNAIDILEQYREKIDWRWLCKNPNAAFYLEENIENKFDKLDWQWLSENPCIFDE